jgi:hypothetical protein
MQNAQVRGNLRYCLLLNNFECSLSAFLCFTQCTSHQNSAFLANVLESFLQINKLVLRGWRVILIISYAAMFILESNILECFYQLESLTALL